LEKKYLQRHYQQQHPNEIFPIEEKKKELIPIEENCSATDESFVSFFLKSFIYLFLFKQ
jgi:hypothetical protein